MNDAHIRLLWSNEVDMLTYKKRLDGFVLLDALN